MSRLLSVFLLLVKILIGRRSSPVSQGADSLCDWLSVEEGKKILIGKRNRPVSQGADLLCDWLSVEQGEELV
jgi:hypothetical protein